MFLASDIYGTIIACTQAHKVVQTNQTAIDTSLIVKKLKMPRFKVMLQFFITGYNTKQQIFLKTYYNNYYNELLNNYYNGIYFLLMTFNIFFFFFVIHKYLSIK